MNIFKSKFKDNFIKKVMIIASGTVFAQILNAILTPVITRLYLPEDFGVLTVYTAILSMLVIVASLRYEWAIPISDNDEKAINILALSVLVLFVFVIAISVFLSFYGEILLSVFSSTSLLQYKYLIPLGILFTGLYSIFTQWALRKTDYISISRTKLSQSIVQNISKISMGVLQFGPVGLVIGSIVGQSFGIMTLSSSIKKDKAVIRKIKFSKICWSAKRYIKFPLFSAPSQLFNTAGVQLPILFISLLYGTATSGHFGLANLIVNIPMVLIGAAVADVFYGEAATVGRYDPKKLKRLLSQLFKKLILIGLVPLTILFLWGPILFSLVFGEIWYEAGVYSRVIAFLVFARLIFTPFSRIFSVYERQKEELILEIFRLALVLITFLVVILMGLNSYWAIGLYTISMSIVYLITFLYANKVINDEIRNSVND